MITRRHRLSIAVLTSLAVVLVGWDGVSSNGPLDLTHTGGEWGGDYPLYATSSFGVILPSDLSIAITIDKVTLAHPHNMKLGGVWLMKHTNDGIRAGFEGFPPSESFPTDWASAVPAAGAIVRPGDRGDLVLKLLSGPETPAEASGVHIEYTAQGKQ